MTYPKKIKLKFARYYCKRLIAKGLPGGIFFLSADMFNFDARKGILIILRTTLVQRCAKSGHKNSQSGPTHLSHLAALTFTRLLSASATIAAADRLFSLKTKRNKNARSCFFVGGVYIIHGQSRIFIHAQRHRAGILQHP
ncbi:hypothetical protein [Raoultella planticola]|uniref:hypothetical protein n=1 Tax=Raoultella planticola TaxID=575 RepID=UPI001F53BB6B|nr:hypothetical protein [Raoultella planticola]UNK74714.1 hypothetical protein MNO12_25085 [Raoultella planticola]